MTSIRLADLADWPTPDGSQGIIDRFRLLSIVAGRLGIVSQPPTAAEWRIARIPVDHLAVVRDAVAEEGERTDRTRIPVGAGHNFRSVRRHPGRAVTAVLNRIDRYLPDSEGT